MVLVFLFITSCHPINISDKRNQNNHTLALNKNFKITSLEPVFLNYGFYRADFFQSGFRINYKEIIIYFDPIMVQNPIKADFIFITHNHVDHFSLKDIDKIYKENTLIIGPNQLAKKLNNYNFKPIKPFESYNLENFKCETIPAYNFKKSNFKLVLHKEKYNYLGYILKFDDISVFHAGDTDYIPDMDKLKNITVALLPIGEKSTAMNPHQAAKAANNFKPEYVIPMHYELDNGSEQKFLDSLNPIIKVKFLN